MNRALYWLSHLLVRLFVQVWLWRGLRGNRRLPEGGCILVANHTSFLDPPLIGTAVPREVRFVARTTLLKIPVFGAWMKAVGSVFVDRDGDPRPAIAKVGELLSEGRVVCVFAEGSRSGDGRIQEFERGLQLMLRRNKVPVVPIGIRGARGSMGRGKHWPRPGRVTMHFGEPLPAERVLAKGGLDDLRQVIAELAETTVAETTGGGTTATESAPTAAQRDPDAAPKEDQRFAADTIGAGRLEH